MNCDQAGALVAAYADGELEGFRKRWLERHLRACARCAAQHADILALRTRLRADAPYFAAPPGLQERVRAIVASTPPTPAAKAPARQRLGWLGGGALAGCAATMLAFVVGTAVIDWRTSDDLVAQAVASHVHATLDHRLIDVASSDRHTVKPWLSQRLDYSPPVRDLAIDGFPLLGGRLATLEGRSVATLVYGYRKHTIDVFVRPEARDVQSLRTVRGFNVAHAHAGGWDWLAVSDTEPAVLNAFLAQLVAEAAKP